MFAINTRYVAGLDNHLTRGKFLIPNHEYDSTSKMLVHLTRLRVAFNWTKKILQAGKAPLDAKRQSGKTATCVQTNEEECWLSAK
jgi:hypothetical protein